MSDFPLHAIIIHIPKIIYQKECRKLTLEGQVSSNSSESLPFSGVFHIVANQEERKHKSKLSRVTS